MDLPLQPLADDGSSSGGGEGGEEGSARAEAAVAGLAPNAYGRLLARKAPVGMPMTQ